MPQLTMSLTGMGACGAGFDSVFDLAAQLAIPLEETTPVVTPAENTLDAWVTTSARVALHSAQSQCPVAIERIGLLYLSTWGSINQTVGYLESMLANDGLYASPRLFTRSVYSAVASQTSIELGIHGACETLSFANLPVYRVLQRAWCLLTTGRLDTVITVWADQVEAPAMQLCQRAAAELHHSQWARYTQPGGGSVALALTRPSELSGRLKLILESPSRTTLNQSKAPRMGAKSASTGQALAVHTPFLPSIPAYPTDSALHLAREILLCHAHRASYLWEEADPPHRAIVRLRAAENTCWC